MTEETEVTENPDTDPDLTDDGDKHDGLPNIPTRHDPPPDEGDRDHE